MRPRTESGLYAIVSPAVVSLLFSGLLLAYGATAAGIVGLLSSWRVALFAIVGAAISFCGIVGYFLVGEAQIKSRLSRRDDLSDSAGKIRHE
jgi:hypothetical protein